MSNRLENNKVAARYAKALFESTLQSNELETVAKALESAKQVFLQLPNLISYLENPGVTQLEKQELLALQFSATNTNPWVYRMLNLLIENNRISAFPQLVTFYSDFINQQSNTAQAEVVTAVELEEELNNRIRQAIEIAFGFSRVELLSRVDPGLLGGVIVKIQDKVIDGSYLSRLEALGKQFSQA